MVITPSPGGLRRPRPSLSSLLTPPTCPCPFIRILSAGIMGKFPRPGAFTGYVAVGKVHRFPRSRPHLGPAFGQRPAGSGTPGLEEKASKLNLYGWQPCPAPSPGGGFLSGAPACRVRVGAGRVPALTMDFSSRAGFQNQGPRPHRQGLFLRSGAGRGLIRTIFH